MLEDHTNPVRPRMRLETRLSKGLSLNLNAGNKFMMPAPCCSTEYVQVLPAFGVTSQDLVLAIYIVIL